MIASVTERTFKQEVLESPTPVLVHFWAPWCGLCKLVSPQLMKFQAVWGEQVKLVGINADNNFRLANTYRLTTLPTLILFDNGEIQQRFENFHCQDDLWTPLEIVTLDLRHRSQPQRMRSLEYHSYSA